MVLVDEWLPRILEWAAAAIAVFQVTHQWIVVVVGLWLEKDAIARGFAQRVRVHEWLESAIQPVGS